ncbi:S1C family serine protease [Sanguibacter antarcticus]|uniref:Putative serine protease PepD n=1 Tax=Sanguibacter antarcticus TaxID=372484 RepID=A0A2A9E3X1_9MICO|nr:trypsin-like peptidase domain-containing protein [Sanguibacter antarcticus]PFG33737.1 putative serine protease PepD [Sanguibacter antarcticus]
MHENAPEGLVPGHGPVPPPPGDDAAVPVAAPSSQEAQLPEPDGYLPDADAFVLPWQPLPRPAREPVRGLGPGLVVVLLVGALVVGALGGVLAPVALDAVAGRPDDASLPTVVPSDDLTRPDGSIADIAATVAPSVVSIQVSGADGQGTGSGFVLREDGYILTNNHVIAGAVPDGRIRVTFADGTEDDATLVGRTADYDLAVLRVEREGLVPLVLGDSDGVVVGDPVIAIGAPLGLDGTVTSGIISALNRPVSAGDVTDTAFINALQTDAAINPGNSGGPLVNGAGEVIGINSAIAQPPGQLSASGSIGLGFAIGSNQARRTAEELIETGVASYPIIGVLLDSTYDGEGVRVSEDDQAGQAAVTPGGPADGAGVESGDVIVSIDGRPVTQPDELIVAIRAKAPGDTVVLRVRSGGDDRDVSIVLDSATSS